MTGWRLPICGSARAQREPGNNTGAWRPGQVDHQGDRVGPVLVRAVCRKVINRPWVCAPRSVRFPPHTFSIDDRRRHALLAPPVGGIDAVDGEEAEQGVPLVAKVLDQAAVGFVANYISSLPARLIVDDPMPGPLRCRSSTYSSTMRRARAK